MKKIFNVIVGLAFCSLTFANSVDSTQVITTDDVENWLKEYADVDTTVTDTLIVEAAHDTVALKPAVPHVVFKPLSLLPTPEPTPTAPIASKPTIKSIKSTPTTPIKRVEWLDTIPIKVADFINKEDSLQIRRDALQRRQYNPLFMNEWVFSTAKKTEKTPETEDEIVASLRQGARAELFKQDPAIYAYHESQLPNIEEIISRRIAVLPNEKIKVDRIARNTSDPINTFKLAVSPWVYNADLQAQISQNYISDNWYTGGESNLTTYFFIKGNLNYNNKKNLQWDNQLNAKFSFNTAGSDTLRLFRTNDDLVKLTSKLGMRITNTKRFYYTAEAEFSTPLFNTYVANTYQRVAGPFSPIRFYMSLGVDYKRDNLSVFVSPLSYKMIYVSDTTTRPGVSVSIADKVGIDAGRKIKNELGSKMKVKWEYALSKEIKMETNFSLYTNYKGVEADWEIIGNFIINRFMSARIALNPRFDSTITLPDDEKPKLQFKELISVGFRYKL
ncbi:MAG: DUF3078 domain-containing protein [Prevotellaceae bacterium]|nr:DUF3078 domain-containing protein [Prevotellaceae bacterium]